MANNFTDVYKNYKLTDRRSSSRIYTMKTTSEYINITLLKISDKEKILKQL